MKLFDPHGLLISEDSMPGILEDIRDVARGLLRHLPPNAKGCVVEMSTQEDDDLRKLEGRGSRDNAYPDGWIRIPPGHSVITIRTRVIPVAVS